MRTLATLALAAASLAAQIAYADTTSLPVPGPVRWDYVSVDADTHRVYLAHSSQVDVVDAQTRKVVQQFSPTPGVHGVAVAGDLRRAFTSNGSANEIGVFDLATGHAIGTVKVGQKPDAITYDPLTHRVFSFNGKSADVSAIDAKTLQVLARSIPAGGSPEFAVADGKGHIFFNLEDKSEMAVLDTQTLSITSHYSLAPCDEPSGLAMDDQQRLYSVCSNQTMVVSDPQTGKVLGHAPIGNGPDGVAWMDGKAYSANGRDGTISVVQETSPGVFKTVATLATEPGARTIAADRSLHELFTPTAQFEHPAASQEAAHAKRPAAVEGSFHLLVIKP